MVFPGESETRIQFFLFTPNAFWRFYTTDFFPNKIFIKKFTPKVFKFQNSPGFYNILIKICFRRFYLSVCLFIKTDCAVIWVSICADNYLATKLSIKD